MSNSFKSFAVSSLLLFSIVSSAQVFKTSFDPIFRDSNGKILSLALAGGLNQPQITMTNFNADNLPDIFIFDRTGNKILVFLAENTGGQLRYKYAPEYEDFFPKGQEFMQLVDYNGDGKEDLWMYNGDSVHLYRNYTTSIPDFRRVKGLKAFDKVSYVPFNPYKKLGIIKGNLPAIVDIDGDTDIDYITSLNLIGSEMIFNCNLSANLAEPLENIEFNVVDKCYGGVSENAGDVIINAPCLFNEAYKLKKKHSAAKTLLFVDVDEDGDKDLFYGSSEQLNTPVYFLENGKADFDFYKDTFISISKNYFNADEKAQFPIAPGMFYQDIDLDGVKDLILCTNDNDKSSYPVRETENVILYLNSGTNNKPVFKFNKNDFLVGDMVDFGSHTAPTFADLDGDGDQDLVMGTNGDHYTTGDTLDHLVYYENIGSSTNPDFQLKNSNFLDIKSRKYKRVTPAFADLDSDGDLDLYMGNSTGNIIEFTNTGTAINPVFVWSTDNFENVDAGSNSAPCFYDLNKDGMLDLLVGTYDGPIQYYQNSGSVTMPAYSLTDDTLGGVVVNEMIRQSILGPTGLYDTFVHEYFAYSAPQIVTWPNGAKCLAVGGNEGKVRLFNIYDDITRDFSEEVEYMNRGLIGKKFIKDWGVRVYPAAADLNGDGVSDILVGNLRGGIHYMQGTSDKRNVGIRVTELKKFSVSPNPATNLLTFHTKDSKPFEYSIMDVSGKVVKQGTARSQVAYNIVSDLVNGMYFVSLSSEETKYATQKLIINK